MKGQRNMFSISTHLIPSMVLLNEKDRKCILSEYYIFLDIQILQSYSEVIKHIRVVYRSDKIDGNSSEVTSYEHTYNL